MLARPLPPSALGRALLGGFRRRLVTVVVGATIVGGSIWLISQQPPTALAASCAGGGYGGGGSGGYGAPTGTCGPYVPLPPTRVLDTRDGTGGTTGPVGPGGTVTVSGASLVAAGLPSVGGASAVVLNVTATDPTLGSYITVWPDTSARPLASNLNVAPGETVANLVEVALGTDGGVSFYNAQGDIQIVADVEGYVSTAAQGNAGLYNPVPLVRVLDTRTGNGGTTGPIGPGQTVQFAVTGGTTGVPASGVEAVVFNLTATDPTSASYITAYPGATAKPLASNLNFTAGETIANRVILKVVNGYVDLFNDLGDVQLVADLNGYYTSASAPAASGSDFNTQPPTRLADTRPDSGQPYSNSTLGPGSTLTITVAGAAGVPLMTASSPPSAVVLNVTAVEPTAGTYITVYPTSASRPVVSDINLGPGQIQPNLVVVQLSSLGQINVFNDLGDVDIVVDVEGWYS